MMFVTLRLVGTQRIAVLLDDIRSISDCGDKGTLVQFSDWSDRYLATSFDETLDILAEAAGGPPRRRPGDEVRVVCSICGDILSGCSQQHSPPTSERCDERPEPQSPL